MFITEITNRAYDFVVIGAGPAGITLAWQLSQQSEARILLVESGELESNPDIHGLSNVVATGDVPSGHYPVHAQRNFGGTTNVWAGYCTTLEKRAFLNGQWLINYEEIEPFYKDAAEILELPPEAYQTPSRKIAQDINHIRYRPYYLSPPVRFKEKYLTYFEEHPNIDVLLNHTCTDILSNGTIIDGVLLRHSDGGSDSVTKVQARYYVLACGGLGNPRLMQLAKISSESPVGQYFMMHPHLHNAGIVEIDKAIIDPVLQRGRLVQALQLSDEYCVKNNLLNFSVSFSIHRVETRTFLGAKRDTYISNGFIRAEMPALAENKTALSENVDALQQPVSNVNFEFKYLDIAKKNWRLFAKELLASGLGRAATPPETYQSLSGGGHYIGTTRMGTDAKNSVVDKDCKVHTKENLYVAGSSIFPAAAAANPTFSIVAFALRLANYLLDKFHRENL